MPKENVLEDKFLTSTKFSQEIERLVHESNGLITYIEAVVAYCQDKEIELETVPKLLAKPLKERLKCEAQRLNYMKQSSNPIEDSPKGNQQLMPDESNILDENDL